MKIYFAGSIRGGRKDAALYNELITHLGNYGEVLTEHIGELKMTHPGDDGPSDRFIHDRDMEWLIRSDVIVAEVTTVSMGVGYEIGRAVEMGKKVLCLYRPGTGKNLSAMIGGSPQLELVKYFTTEEAKKSIDFFLNNLER